jgi:soluble cytochrome b562
VGKWEENKFQEQMKTIIDQTDKAKVDAAAGAAEAAEAEVIEVADIVVTWE